MSTRKLTLQQFEDKTVLDTEGFEQGIHDIFESLNNIGPDIDTSSTVQKQVVWGECPPQIIVPTFPINVGVETAVAPFLPVIPTTNALTAIREERLKSNDPYGVTCVPPSSLIAAVATGWNWQMSFWTEEPIIVTDLDIFMHMADPNYSQIYTDPGDFKWYSNAPAPLEPTYPLEDIVVSLTVDSPNNQQDASQVALTVHKNFFAMSSQRLLEADIWSTPDMLPTLPDKLEYTRGFEIQAKEINAPIPAKSRVRVNIFMPNYIQVEGEEGPVNEWATAVDGGYQTWKRFMWSNCLTFLERKQNG